MKTSTRFSKDFFKYLEFNPHEKVMGIIKMNGGVIKFETPKVFDEVSCPTCNENSGYRVIDHSGKYWSCKNQECLKLISKSKEEVKFQFPLLPQNAFNIPSAFEECSIDDLLNEDHKHFLKEWCLKPQGTIIMTGGTGRGKTYASIAILEHYRKNLGQSAWFINLAQLYLDWLHLNNEKNSLLSLLNKLADVKILVIDDMGIRAPSEAFLDFLYLIINKRINQKNIGTIVTTNLSSAQMLEKYGDQITSRIASGKVIKFEGADKRLDF